MIGLMILDRYRIDSELGKGGMGIVYRAFDTLLEREVAIKVLSDEGLSADSQIRLLEEARAAAGLSHPNIVTVYDVVEFDESMFIIMELLQGISLREQSDRDLDHILEYFEQLCGALSHAHQHGVIHRDLKPENVILVEDQIKLMDFGLARSMSSRLSAEGALAGTASYLAPEQALGMDVDARTDLYSLGVMLYEMAAGRLPFTEGDALAVISQHLHAPVVPPRTYNKAISPELNELVLRLMSKNLEDRPSSAEQVLSMLSDLSKSDGDLVAAGEITLLQQIIQGKIVGRQAELKSLRQLWRQAQQGNAQLVLISGEPGVGKTRLANELVSYAQLHGGKVLRGGCYENEARVPYLPIAEALRDWIRGQTPDQLQNQMGEIAPELAKLAPEIVNKLGPIEPNPALSSEQERIRMFDHFARFLSDLAVDRGLIIFLDDLHWADKGTLSLIHYLLRRLRDEGVLLMGGYREIELDRTHPLSTALVDWNRERIVTRIQLGRLTKEDCGQLLASMFEQDEVSPEFTEAIYQETEGNPFFIEEVVKALIDSGQIYRENLEWQRGNIEDLAIPQSIKEAIGRRLNRLSMESIAVLQQAAVLGKVFDFQELLMINSENGGRDYFREDLLLEALDEGLDAQLIRSLEGEAFSFTHDKIRETLYGEMNSIRQRRFHKKIAQGIEKNISENKINSYLPDLAYHFLQGGDLDKGMEYAIRAGEQAQSLYANEEALSYYLQAAEAAMELDQLEELSEIYLTIGDLYLAQGLSNEAIENFNHAMSIVKHGEEKAKIKMKIGESYASVGDARGLDFLQSAKEGLNPEIHSDEYAETLTWIGRYYHYQAQHRQAINAFETALELLTSSDKYQIKCQIFSFLAGSYQHILEFKRSDYWANECLTLGEKNDDPSWIAVGNEFLAENAVTKGRWNDGLEYSNNDREIGKKIGALDRVAWGKFTQAEILYGLGQLNEALSVGQSALNLVEQIGENRLAILIRSNLSKVQVAMDLMEEAEENARIAVSQADELDQDFMQCWSRYAYASLLVNQKEWDKALQVCEEGKLIYEGGENLAAKGHIFNILPLALLGAGRVAEARSVVDEHLRVVSESEMDHSHGIALRMKGQITAIVKDYGDSHLAYNASIKMLESIGSRLELGRTYYHRGILLENIGKREDADMDLQIALNIFKECGAIYDLKLVQQLSASIS